MGRLFWLLEGVVHVGDVDRLLLLWRWWWGLWHELWYTGVRLYVGVRRVRCMPIDGTGIGCIIDGSRIGRIIEGSRIGRIIDRSGIGCMKDGSRIGWCVKDG